jgi:hypothetical protein
LRHTVENPRGQFPHFAKRPAGIGHDEKYPRLLERIVGQSPQTLASCGPGSLTAQYWVCSPQRHLSDRANCGLPARVASKVPISVIWRRRRRRTSVLRQVVPSRLSRWADTTLQTRQPPSRQPPRHLNPDGGQHGDAARLRGAPKRRVLIPPPFHCPLTTASSNFPSVSPRRRAHVVHQHPSSFSFATSAPSATTTHEAAVAAILVGYPPNYAIGHGLSKLPMIVEKSHPAKSKNSGASLLLLRENGPPPIHD